jgi:hypothetical protein
MKIRGIKVINDAVQFPTMTPKHEWEVKMLPIAQKELARIFKIHGIKKSMRKIGFRPRFDNQPYLGTGTIIA